MNNQRMESERVTRELFKHGLWNDEPINTGNKPVDEALNEISSFLSMLNDYAVEHGLMVKPIPQPLFEKMGGDKGLDPISHLLAVGQVRSILIFPLTERLPQVFRLMHDVEQKRRKMEAEGTLKKHQLLLFDSPKGEHRIVEGFADLLEYDDPSEEEVSFVAITPAVLSAPDISEVVKRIKVLEGKPIRPATLFFAFHLKQLPWEMPEIQQFFRRLFGIWPTFLHYLSQEDDLYLGMSSVMTATLCAIAEEDASQGTGISFKRYKQLIKDNTVISRAEAKRMGYKSPKEARLRAKSIKRHIKDSLRELGLRL